MYVGVDVGGTSTRIGLFPSLSSSDFTLLSRFPTSQEYTQQIDMINQVLQQASLSPLSGIGVSIGGQLAKDGRSIGHAPNLPSYVDRPFAADLERYWPCPVRLAHDTVCGLLGEKRFGSIQPYERCAYLTLSTGTGAAIFLAKGATSLMVSIEIGHQILDGNTLTCLCGQIGCLETQTGGRQLELRLGCSTDQITDQAFWDHLCEKLAVGLINLSQLTRVEAVAVSGAMVLHNDFLLPLLQQHLNVRLVKAPLFLFPAALGENAPLVGAANLLTVDEDSILH